MRIRLFGKICIMVSIFILISSQLYAQRDSIYFKDSVFVLYSNGIFKTCTVPRKGYYHHQTSGIWTIVQDSLIRLKSFDEYKCEILNVQAYYDSAISDYETVVYDTNGDTAYHAIGVSQFYEEPTITPAPYCHSYTADTAKYNHFVFVVQSKWNYEDIYIDQLFKITPEGLKWVKNPE